MNKRLMLNIRVKPRTLSLVTLAALLCACQTTSPPDVTPDQPVPIETPAPGPRQEGGVTIIPYPDDGIKRKPITAPPAPAAKPQVKAPPAPAPEPTPAYEVLIQQTKTAYFTKQWDKAERLALQVQRIAPQSAENYYYLSRIALHNEQYKSAEAFAKRGLSYAKTAPMKKILWSAIADIGRAQKNPAMTLEAQKEILKLGS